MSISTQIVSNCSKATPETLDVAIDNQQTKEIEAITSRWQADSMSDSWMSKNVRPLVLVWCICVFSLAGILDSIETNKVSLNFVQNGQK